MSVSLTNVESKVRYVLNDTIESVSDIFTYSTSRIFTLEESYPVTATAVYINDTVLPVSDWSYSSSKVTIDDTLTSNYSLSAGDSVKIEYTCYKNFSSTEVASAIRTVLMYLSINNYLDFIVDSGNNIQPEPTVKEQNLIAIISAYKLRPDVSNLRLPDFSVSNRDALNFEDFARKTLSYNDWSGGIWETVSRS